MSTADDVARPQQIPAGASAEGDGIALGHGAAQVDVYVDFLCPYCRAFEQRDGTALDELTERGVIKLVYHPVGFLDRLSTTRYSSRAAAAAGCAADGGRFREYVYALYDAQPPENSAGLSDEELIRLGRQAALEESFPKCVSAGRYLPWADYVTELAIAHGVSGTPSVSVDGLSVEASVDAITAAALAELG